MLVTLIVGLPGSGKSFLAKKICAETNSVLIDDPKDLNFIEKKVDMVICDPYLCFKEVRDQAGKILKENDYTLDWIFFENNPEQCIINAKKRQIKSVYHLIKLLSFAYDIPQNVNAIPVWREHENH